MIETTTDWLTHPIPLWVFLLALLTTPTLWSRKIASRIGPLLDQYLPAPDDSPEAEPNR